MKWLIASDIHGASDYCKKLIERYEIESADKILLLGDILYHGPRNAYAREEVYRLYVTEANCFY